jgi:SAM-dependent methyltransferase
MKTENVDALSHVARLVGYRNLRRYQSRADFLFRDIPLSGSRVLDVGCGRGTWAVWAALHGAGYVLGLEPESDGSSNGSLKTFHRLIAELDLERVEGSSLPVQKLPVPIDPFDLVILYNVINHLNEDAVQRLHKDPAAVNSYKALLGHLRQLLRPGGVLVMADCGRNNFWHKRGWQSPIDPNIEWDKHQDPETWISIFGQAGFRLQDQRWSPFYPFYPLGRLLANRLTQHLTASHFVLRFRAV